MAKLNLSALSAQTQPSSQEIENTLQATHTAFEETLENTSQPAVSSQKVKISLKNGKINTVSHQEIINIVNQSPSSLRENEEIKIHKAKETKAKISLKKEEQKIEPNSSVVNTEIISNPKEEPNITQNTNISEISASQVKTEVAQVSIQDADTAVNVIVHEKKEIFGNYSGSYNQNTEKTEEVTPEATETITAKSETIQIPEIKEIKTIEKSEEKIEMNKDNSKQESTQKITALTRFQFSKKQKIYSATGIGIVAVFGMMSFFLFDTPPTQNIKGNINEIHQLPPPPPSEITLGVTHEEIMQETQSGNVNENLPTIVDNSDKNDKMKEEVKRYLLNKYKHK